MPVDEPQDILEELLRLAEGYVGPRVWPADPDARRSNPIKLRSPDAPKVKFAHLSSRTELSAREGAALLYCVRSQHVEVRPGAVFSRYFSHPDGRELMLEDGVVRDLLAVGVISQRDAQTPLDFVITGLGSSEINSRFPEQAS